MAAEMAIGQTKRQAMASKVLPADSWKEFNGQASDVQGLLQLSFHATCAALPMYGIYHARQVGSLHGLLICEVLLAYVSSFYFMGYHEIIHLTAFRSKWINKFLSYPLGFALFRGPNWFWCFHWLHHRYTQDPDLDPEISGSSTDTNDPTKSIAAYMKFMTGWSFGFERVLMMARGEMQHHDWVIRSGMQKTVRIESMVFAALYLAIAVGAILDATVRECVILYWLLPHAMGAGHLRFYQFAEHRGCEMGHYEDLDAWGSVRTTFTNIFYCRLAWNMPYHIEHHSWPSVPFYLLPALHKRIRESQPPCRAPVGGEKGYLGVHKEFLQRIWNKEPTNPPMVPRGGDQENGGGTAVAEERRAQIRKKAESMGSFKIADVAKHASKDDCWVVVNGLVIDVTTFLTEHPGGEMVLAEKAGRDVSLMFKMIHPENTLERHLPDRCIAGVLDDLKKPLLSA